MIAALSWVFLPTLFGDLGVTDELVAVAVAMLLFLIPVGKDDRLLDGATAREIPWEILLLFGGGLSLSAAFTKSGLSTWIGDLSAGVGTLHVILLVLVVTALVMALTEMTSNTATAATFLPVLGGVAAGTDKALPWSTKKYRELYTELMRDLPTLELRANSTNTIADTVMVNKEVEGNTVHDIVLFETSSARQGQILSAPKAEVSLYDLQSFIYQLKLDDPLILKSESQSGWALSKAESAQFFLNFSGQIASIASALPSQLSVNELRQNIQTHKLALDEEKKRYEEKIRQAELSLAELVEQSKMDSLVPVSRIAELQLELERLEAQKPINFYYQYYRAELHKKFALSAACFMLVFLTFSLSFFRVKHGRLIGFGLSMLVAVLYWYLLFFAQMQIFSISVTPAFLIWSPNLIMFISGLLLLLHARRL